MASLATARDAHRRRSDEYEEGEGDSPSSSSPSPLSSQSSSPSSSLSLSLSSPPPPSSSSSSPPPPPPPGCGCAADHKQARQRVAEFLREAERIARQVEKLEKERKLSAQCRKNGWADVSGELEEHEKALEDARTSKKTSLQKQLAKSHNGVKKFQRQLMDIKPTPRLIQRLKETMSEVEASITALKEEQRQSFEELMKEERTCRREIGACRKKIDNWGLVAKPEPRPVAAPAPKPRPPGKRLPAEVTAPESVLPRAGGVYGGWDQYDHQTFLRIWTKHRGQPAYRKEARLHLPMKTLAELKQHEDWHRTLIQLQDRKRQAIRRWKASKQPEGPAGAQRQEEVERKRNEDEAQQHTSEEVRRGAATLRREGWKEVKTSKEEQEEELRLSEEAGKRSLEKPEVKLNIEEQPRPNREEEEEDQDEEEEMEDRRKRAAKGIKHLSERDLHRMQAKPQQRQLRGKGEEEERKERITSELKEKVKRVGRATGDPPRLNRPTKGWEERMKNVGR